LHLPPLRERTEDIPLLVGHFIKKFNKQMGRNVQGIADQVLEALETYPWPGNVRELANAIEHAFVHCRGLLIHLGDLPQNVIDAVPSVTVPRSHKPQEKLDLIERDLIVRELEAAHWKKTAAARRLGMSRATLWRKMEKYGIEK
jgi:DNA-binding NtrC family response regulator